MTAPVEAQSLSQLTNLLANPPHYPRNPTHKVHAPLVLYIVRVPGSQDVFLSPIKPPTKVSVSLEAIQSSLYYFHIETEEDEIVRRSLEQEQATEQNNSPSTPVHRKPLSTTYHPLPPVPDDIRYDRTHEHANQMQHSTYQSDHESWSGNTVAQPSPLRLRTDMNSLAYDHVPHNGYAAFNQVPGDYSISPSLHEISDSRTTVPAFIPMSRTAEYTHQQSPSTSAAFVRDPGSKLVTIIRRDPATNSQWNIGTITFLESTFGGSNMKPVRVELTTPGYGRFGKGAGFDTSRPVSAGTDAPSIRRALENASINSSIPPMENHGIFSRIVDFRRIKLSELRHTVYQRTNSWDKPDSEKTHTRAALEKNALTFDSPWFGQCTFVNGIDGNSLKLKHTIKSNSSSGDGLTANVAELRFNLGWSIFSNVKESQKNKDSEPDKLPIPKLLDSKKENFRKSFQHFKERSRESFRSDKTRDDDALRDLSNIQTPNTNSLATAPAYNGHHTPASPANRTSDHDDDEHRLSLKLGREKAGGGFRGKSAKLGKLIVEDEGLKMCDLVVGAAMGVWWQHYQGNA